MVCLRSVDKVYIGASAVLEHFGKGERLGDRLELANVVDAIGQACQLCHGAVEGYFDPLLVEPAEKFLISFRGSPSRWALCTPKLKYS